MNFLKEPNHKQFRETNTPFRWGPLVIAALAVLLTMSGPAIWALLSWKIIRKTPPPTLAEEPATKQFMEEETTRQHRELSDSEEINLSSYQWSDRGTGTVRIPIERAMQIVSERGLPARRRPGQR